jgi:hypothetical protein
MRWQGCRAPGAYSLLPPDPRILLASPVRPSASRNVTAAGGRQPVVDDLSLQVMAERKAGSDRAVGPAVLAVALEEATRACKRAAASLDLCRVAVERGRNACSGEPLSGHARCLHLLGRLRQVIAPEVIDDAVARNGPPKVHSEARLTLPPAAAAIDAASASPGDVCHLALCLSPSNWRRRSRCASQRIVGWRGHRSASPTAGPSRGCTCASPSRWKALKLFRFRRTNSRLRRRLASRVSRSKLARFSLRRASSGESRFW